MTKGNLKLAYWGAGGFVDLDSAYNKTTKAWAYNAISISFARFIVEKGSVNSNTKGTFKYFMDEWKGAQDNKTFSLGIGIPNNFYIDGKAVQNQNSIQQGTIIDDTLVRLAKGELPKPNNLLLSFRDPLLTGLKGTTDINSNDMDTILQDPSATQHLVKGFLDLNKYYNNIFNGIDYDIEVPSESEKPLISTFLEHMTTEIKKNKTIDKNEYIVTAAPCCGLYEEYEKIKGIDYLIPQNHYNGYQNSSCNTMIESNKYLNGFQSWSMNSSPIGDNWQTINNCMKSQAPNTGGTSMWDLEWDVLGNETDDMAKAVRDCCKKTHGNSNKSDPNYKECINISSRYSRYTYSNNIQKDELPSLAINLDKSNIVFPNMCKSSIPSSTDPSIKGILIQNNNLIINYNSGNIPGPAPSSSKGLNGLFYTTSQLKLLDIPNMKIPVGTKKFTVCGFTMPNPIGKESWFNHTSLDWSTFPHNNNIKGSLCFGGSTATKDIWRIFLTQLSTKSQVIEFINYYFTDTNGWNNWDTLMLDMEASDATDNDPYNNLKSEIDATLPLLYSQLKNIGKSLYLVVLPNQYNNYLGKMDVDGIISMNYNGSPGSAYKGYFT